MKNASSQIKVFLFICLAILIIACQAGAALTPTPTIDFAAVKTSAAATAFVQLTELAASWTRTPTLTMTPTSSLLSPTITYAPEPTEYLLPLSHASDPKAFVLSIGNPPDFIVPGGSIPNKPGDYIIYKQRGLQVSYISLDGSIKGDLFNFKSPFQDVFLTSTQNAPKLVFISPGLEPRNIWVTDLVGNSLKNWQVDVDPDFACAGPYFSPSGHWMVIACGSYGKITAASKVYINIINVETGEKKMSASHCWGGVALGLPGYKWANTSWAKDEAQFSYYCSGYTYHCLISTATAEGICKDTGKIMLSVSPGWNKVLLGLGDMPSSADGEVRGTRMLLADLKCVLQKSFCTQGVELDFPYHQNMPADVYPLLNIYWDKLGQHFAWMNTPFHNGKQLQNKSEIPSCGWMNLETGQNQQLCQQAGPNTKLVGIAPDETSFVFVDNNLLYLMSITDQTIQTLVDQGHDMSPDIHFYGWLSIP